MSGRVTIVDVAKLAGTSTASVSYYLNGKLEKLGEPTQKRIAAAIRETGYVPNAQAQALSGKQTHVIGLILLDNTNLWAGQIQGGVESIAREAGFQTVVCGTDFNRENEHACVEKLLSLGVDGFIIQPTSNFKAVHERISRAGRPVVFFDCDTFDLSTSWVKANLYEGVYNAISTCVERGYDRFISVAAPNNGRTQLRTRLERQSAFADALSARGLDYDEIEVTHASPTVDELYERFKYAISPAHRTLIFAQNQWCLSRVFQALEQSRHLMPERIGLLGLNCSEWAPLTTPSISTVIEPVRQMGRLSCQMLIEQLEDEDAKPRQEILSCRTRWLDSTL
jgi:LacI family transcriptional regulator, kdg operon repressor